MPIFYQQDINPHIRLGIWKIEEDETFFLRKVPDAQKVTHPNKRLQHLAGRYLLQYLFPHFPYHEILIADTRKPYLPQEQFHFSISHSGNYAAAIVSETERAGIDIELYSPKTELVKHKFLSEEELELVIGRPATNDQLFTLLWCCKEAVYKYWGVGGIDFKRDINIQDINAEKQEIDVGFAKNNSWLTIHYSLFEKLSLAWVINK